MTIFFLLLNISFALIIFFLTIAFITGAPFVRSNKKAADAMIRLARLKPGMKIYDLGSGDGTILFRAASLGATAVGLEINPFLVLWTYVKILFSQHRNTIIIRWQNFWSASLHDADVVFVYLLPWRMKSLEIPMPMYMFLRYNRPKQKSCQFTLDRRKIGIVFIYNFSCYNNHAYEHHHL
ncbi:MAG: hypothetical protein UY10_C0028G0003 [Microgenomates group bacterium GW2011_GWA2_47_8]|nr:MAG: hypothetical protein UY10_C0028G0003 [Microgenomates group bacterium GW2011_GWA2_47_8]